MQMMMIIFIEKNKNITLKGNKHLEIIAGKKIFFASKEAAELFRQ